MNTIKIILFAAAVCLATVLGCHKTPGRQRADREATSPSSRPLKDLSKGNPADYKWLAELDQYNLLVNRVRPPEGFERAPANRGSFGNWLRHLPLKEGKGELHLTNGKPQADQAGHVAIVNIDPGRGDFQRDANAVLRLRAEYLFGTDRQGSLRFKTNAGQWLPWKNWAAGERYTIRSGQVRWDKRFSADSSHGNFRRYLDEVMRHSGCAGLLLDTEAVPDTGAIEIGMMFIKQGNPPQAAIVVDVAGQPFGNKKVFMLAGAATPADEIHILTNPDDAKLSPWFPADFGQSLKTPLGTFTRADLRRF